MSLTCKPKSGGFTFVELMVAISLIAILSAIVYANFGNARAAARDDIRKSALKEVQLALELYKAQNGSYPDAGCGTADMVWAGPDAIGAHVACDDYISGLVAGGFIPELPRDPSDETGTEGFLYRTDGANYKLLVAGKAEAKTIDSFNDEFARCPAQTSAGWGCPNSTPPQNTYAVYSAGAWDW